MCIVDVREERTKDVLLPKNEHFKVKEKMSKEVVSFFVVVAVVVFSLSMV